MKISSKYAIALTAALGLFMAVLDNTIVNVALTPIQKALDNGTNTVSLSAVQWIVTGYFLSQAASIPVAGYFSNRFGAKRLFLICLALFTVGSLLCGLSGAIAGSGTSAVTTLVVFRVIQGIGGGALFPLAQSIALQAFPPNERASSSAVIGIPVLIAPILGPTVGGILTVAFGWEYIFFVNVPVGIIAIFLAWRILPADNISEERALRGRTFDLIGLLLSITGVTALVYGFSLVGEGQPGSQTPLNPRGTLRGWGDGNVYLWIGIGLVLLAAFTVYELVISKDPVLDLRLFSRYDFTMGSVITWFISVVVFGSLFLLPIFLEQVRVATLAVPDLVRTIQTQGRDAVHLSALDAGLALIPQGLAAMIAVALTGRILYNRMGVRYLVMLGALCIVVSSFGLSNLEPTSDGLSLTPWLILRGLGFGFCLIPTQTYALQKIVGPALAKASSLFNVTRQIFSSIGIAVLTTLFASQTSSHVGQYLPQGQATGAGGAVDPNNPAVQAAQAKLFAQAGTNGINDVFFIVGIATIALFVFAIFLPGPVKKGDPAAAESEGRPMVAME